MPSLLDHDVATLPGIGKKSAEILRRRGHETVGDLLWLLPKRYVDQRTPVPIPLLRPGTYAVVLGRVDSQRRFSRGRTMGLEVRLGPESEEPSDGPSELKLVWFQASPGVAKQFERGVVVRVAGDVKEYRGVLSMAHPEVLDAEGAGGVEPRYPEIPGLRRKPLRRAVRAAVDRASAQVPDLVPAHIRAELGLTGVGQALHAIHVPVDNDRVSFEAGTEHPAQQRLALEELVLWELALRRRRSKDARGSARPFPMEPCVSGAKHAFSFELTGAQEAAVERLGRSLESDEAMRCLLQGDVGCGKTAVALIACSQVIGGGAQAALLAPTELLAEQHAESLRSVTDRLGLRLGLFTGALSNDQRRSMLDRMSTGAVDLIVGTHALLSGEIRFADLGLLVVDEQHRFGVAQRLRLGAREAAHVPHLLVMTATPIPRSLALVLYSGLDLVVIDEKPPGRQPPATRRLARTQREKLHRQIARAIEAGGRAFVVCPAISGTDDVVGVDAVFDELVARFGADVVGAVHGRLSSHARRDVMREFSEGSVRVLVGTTVLEVGVDVPTANLIVVEQAERFGLAQLHQLRGRVGRHGQKSACILAHGANLTEDADRRLTALCESHDGFALAETDLELRGPGHLFGYRQSGASGLRFADLRDMALLERAGAIATRLLGDDPELARPEHAAARAAVDRWERYGAVREEAG